MTEVFTIEIEPVDKRFPAAVRLRKALKALAYYGFRVTRCAARHANPEPGQPALSPLPERKREARMRREVEGKP